MTLRKVIAYSSGGADTVLFSCGHACVLEVAQGGRPRDYPKRRQCFRCPDEAPIPVQTEAEFKHKRRGSTVIHWIGGDDV